jgi:oligosaccharide repeat unit polymerase
LLINPALIYAYIWLLASFFYTRYWSEIFLPLSDGTLAYILGSIIAVGFSWAITKIIFANKPSLFNKNRELIKFSSSIKKKIVFITYVWCTFSFVELLYHRGLPILTVFGVGSITYDIYGIPSLHGFLNALILSLSMYMLYMLIETKSKKYLFLYMLTILPFILMMTRGGVTSLLLQSLFVLMLFKEIRFSLLVKLLLLSFIFIFAFAYLGELRNTNPATDIYQVLQISSSYPDFLPKEFMWIYMYISSSINNLQNMMGVYDNWNFEPYILLYGMLPSFLRNALPMPYHVDLVVISFNVSSFMPKYLAAFGVFGSLIFYFISALVPLYFYQKFLRTRNVKHGFILVIFLHTIILSIFSDFFLIQVYIFQILLQYFIFSKIVIGVRKYKLKDFDNFYIKDMYVYK